MTGHSEKNSVTQIETFLSDDLDIILKGIGIDSCNGKIICIKKKEKKIIIKDQLLKLKKKHIDEDIKIFGEALRTIFYIRPRNSSPKSYDLVPIIEQAYRNIFPTVDENWIVEDELNQSVIRTKKSYNSRLFSQFSKRNTSKPLSKGDSVDILIPHLGQNIHEEGGDWYTINSSPYYLTDTDDVVRIYFNLEPHKSIYLFERFVTEIFTEFYHRKIVFFCKFLKNTENYQRADSIVFYILKSNFYACIDVIKYIWTLVEPITVPDTPLFTLKVSDGLAIAEEPIDLEGLSFGESRCRAIAQIIVKEWLLNETVSNSLTPEFIVDKIKELKSFNYLQPFLNNVSGIEIQPNSDTSLKIALLAERTNFRTIFSQHIFLKASTQLAYHLCTQGIWKNENECSWVRMCLNDNLSKIELSNGDLYSGTAGIALYLFKLYRIHPDPTFYRYANGAIRFSLADEKINFCGLYKSKLGIACVLAEVIIDLESMPTQYFNGSDLEFYKTALKEIYTNIPDLKDCNTELIANTIKGLVHLRKNFKILGIDINEINEILKKLCDKLSNSKAIIEISVKLGLINLGIITELTEDILLDSIVNEPDIDINANSTLKFDPEITDNVLSDLMHRLYIFDNASDKSKIIIKKYIEYATTNFLFRKLRIEETNMIEVDKILLYDKTFKSLNYGLIGLADLLLYVSESRVNFGFRHQISKRILDNFGKEIIEDYLKYDQLPPMQFDFTFNNPGFMDGIAGLGYFFLRLHDPKIAPSFLLLNHS